MLITDTGTIIRINVSEINVLGRSTQGVTLMRTNEGKVVSIETVENEEKENGENNSTDKTE
jgi:DNA gyrase subunit A